jgi:drug/metabolite transporter (DMT)-like permease
MLPRRNASTIALCLAVLYTVWGSTYLAQRIAVAGFPPLRMAGIRFTLAGGLLYAALRVRGAKAPQPRAWGAAALSAIPLLVLGMGGVAIAVQRVPSGLAALVFGSVPLWTALFDRLWGGRLGRAEIAGLFVGFLGVSLVSLRGALGADPSGAALLCASAASYALGCVLTRRLPLPPGITGTAVQMLSGGVMLLAASAIAGERASTPSRASLFALAYVIVLGSILAYSAFGYLLRNARPALATSYAYVNPIVALGLGTLLGGEHVTRTDVAGLTLVLSAVGLVALGRGRIGAKGAPALADFRVGDHHAGSSPCTPSPLRSAEARSFSR